MPINKMSQARIDLSKAQVEAFVEWWSEQKVKPQAVSLEETNLENTHAIITKRGTSTLHHTGEVHGLGRGA